MKIYVTVTTRSYLEFQFNKLEYVPSVGDTMVIKEHGGSYLSLVITKKEFHVDIKQEAEIVYLEAIENN